MNNEIKLTTLSQFGARVSLAKLHIKCLLDSVKSCEDDINHIFYLVDPNNKDLYKYLQKIVDDNKNIYLFTREDNDYTPFKRLKKRAPYGGDCNYDFLIRRPEVGKLFLTMHDDTLINSKNLLKDINLLIKEADFAGFLDTRREITGYQNILFEDKTMLDLRLGTWFTVGRTETYIDNNFRLGDYRNYWKYFLWALYGFDHRLKFLKQKIWLNGGFDLNIRGRVENFRFNTNEADINIAEHYEKITGFFAATKRNLLRYADTEEEFYRWKDYFTHLRKANDEAQILHDIEYLMKLAKKFESNDINDAFLNTETIKELSKNKLRNL